MQSYSVTINAASTQENFAVADYSDAVIRFAGIWDGNIEFYATNSPANPTSTVFSPLAVQDIESTNWTTAVTSEAGASPSTEFKIFRVPVAGFTHIAVKSSSGFSGSVLVYVTAVSNTNAR